MSVRLPIRIFFVACAATALSAECADAGICRLAPRSVTEPEQTWSLGVTLGVARGSTQNGVDYRTVTASAAWRPLEHTTLGVDLPFVSLRGPSGDASGVGDVLVRAEQQIIQTTWGQGAVQIGARLATGNDNANPGLPQAYQIGLGPADVLFGVAWSRGGFAAGLAYALAGGANDLVGTELKRGDDVALRVGYVHDLDDWSIGLTAVAVTRLDESTVASSGGRVAVSGSDGTQVNLRPMIAWRAQPTVRFEVAVGLPLIKRDSDVDGLTRSLAVDVGAKVAW